MARYDGTPRSGLTRAGVVLVSLVSGQSGQCGDHRVEDDHLRTAGAVHGGPRTRAAAPPITHENGTSHRFRSLLTVKSFPRRSACIRYGPR